MPSFQLLINSDPDKTIMGFLAPKEIAKTIKRMSEMPKGFWFCYSSYLDWDMLMFQSANQTFRHLKFFRFLGQFKSKWLT